MREWGSPFIGQQNAITEFRELKTGEKIIARGDFLYSPDLHSEAMVLETLKLQYGLFKPHFELKYVKVRAYKKDIGWGIKEWHCEVEVHCVVLQNPVDPTTLAKIIGTALIVFAIVFVTWTFFLVVVYTGEKVGGAGLVLIFILIAGVLGLLIWRGFEFKGRKRRVRLGKK